MTMLMTRVMLAFRDLRDGEEGQGLVEYALILALVSIAAIAALTALGTNVSAKLQSVADALT